MQKSFKRFASHKNSPALFKRAAELRQSGSIVEKVLWRALRDQAKESGLKFRYQLPFHPYIADFACPAAKLIIEIDGDTHGTTLIYDQKRTARFVRHGYEVIRFSNFEVMRDPSVVATAIIECALKRRGERWT